MFQHDRSDFIEEMIALVGVVPASPHGARMLSRLAGLLTVGLLAYYGPAIRAETAPLTQPVVFCSLPASRAPVSGSAGGMLPADYGEGSTLVVLEPGGITRTLTDELASACDPDVSFDGERILFAGQKVSGDPWNIWEIRADGTELRQVTHEALDCRRPIYLSTFYTITSAEPWYTVLFERQNGVLNEVGTAPGTSLYTARLDGSELRRITFHPGNDRTPFLMQDGLLLFAGWRRLSDPRFPDGRIGLYGVQADGIDYSFFGGLQGARIQHMPTLTSDGLVVFVENDRLDWHGAGRLAAIRTQRPHHSYEALTDEDQGLFHSPSPLADGGLLVSHRPATGEATFNLLRFWPGTNESASVFEDSENHILHAKLLAARPEPDGRSSTVRPESPTGKLFCLDVYNSDRLPASVEEGGIRRVRVIEGVPRLEVPWDPQSPLAERRLGAISARLLGEAPVEPDGSFHIDLPADLPVRLQLLDAAGEALASCDWIWVRNREFRGCIGCHEDPELTPENRLVQAVSRPATSLTLPPERRRSVTFKQQVLPILRSRCTSCHGHEDDLPFGSLNDEDGARRAYEALLTNTGADASDEGPLVEPGSARSSRLIWQLFGRETTQTSGDGTETMMLIAPGHVELLDDLERSVFTEWIDLGAQWDLPEASRDGDDRETSR